MRYAALFLLLTLAISSPASARSGCCSWHGGVDYCDTSEGTYVCNDGTYSPSCGCEYIPPKKEPTPVVQPKPTLYNAVIMTTSEYQKSPDNFREKLIERLIHEYPQNSLTTISTIVYKNLSDITD